MNIRLYKSGGQGVTKIGEKATEKMNKSVNETMKGLEQYLERAEQMQKSFSAGTRISTPRFKNGSSEKLVEKVTYPNYTRAQTQGSKYAKTQQAYTPKYTATQTQAKAPKYTKTQNQNNVPKYVMSVPMTEDSVLKLVPKGESVGQRIFSRLKDNGVVNFVKKHPKLSMTALNLGGVGLGMGLALTNIQDKEPDTTVDTANTQQAQEDSPGFVIGEDGTPYYYNGSNYTTDFIQGSDGNIYSSQGELLGNVGNDARLAGYDDVFDYNAAKVGIDPSQVAAIQQLLGVNVDGKWGARTQAAYQNVLKQMQADYSGIPYTTYNVSQ